MTTVRASSLISGLKRYGPLGVAAHLISRSGLARVVKDFLDLCFDLRYGTRTFGVLPLENLNIDSQRKSEGEFYVATPHYEFNSIIRQLEIDPANYTFVDQGCGKGRVLVYATQLGFRRIIGIEFSPELAETARHNVQRISKRGDKHVEVITGDAAELRIPLEPCVLFFFNPFSQAVTASVLTRIKEAYDCGNRDFYVIWYNVTNNATPLFKAQWLEILFDESTHSRQGSFLRTCNFRLPYVIFTPRPTPEPPATALERD